MMSALAQPFVSLKSWLTREDELATLNEALRAGAGHVGRLIAIQGQAGIGKSRLAWEFLKYIDGLADVIYWHHGRSPSYGSGITFWALGEMVRARAVYFLKFFDEPGNPTRGRSVFNEKGCGACHPLSGKGKEGEPGLDQFPQNISPVFLSQTIWNHGPVMIARMVQLGIKWPEFKATDMMDLLEFIKTNTKGETKEGAFITPGNPREGKRVLLRKKDVSNAMRFGERGERKEEISAEKRKPFIRA